MTTPLVGFHADPPHAAEKHKTGQNMTRHILTRFEKSLLAAVTLLETFNPAVRIHQTGLAGIKRMALRTRVDGHRLDGGPRRNHVSASTRNRRHIIFGMNFFLHDTIIPFQLSIKDSQIRRNAQDLCCIR
jgi:hypothetical protein